MENFKTPIEILAGLVVIFPAAKLFLKKVKYFLVKKPKEVDFSKHFSVF
jgi:hypothetical protein